LEVGPTPDFEAASKYLSNGWLASSGFLGGADFSLSFEVPLSLLSALLRAAFAKADMLLEIDAELISEPEPNSFSSFLDSAFNLPIRPDFFFFSPPIHSDCVDIFDSLLPVDNLSTEVSLSSLRIDREL